MAKKSTKTTTTKAVASAKPAGGTKTNNLGSLKALKNVSNAASIVGWIGFSLVLLGGLVFLFIDMVAVPRPLSIVGSESDDDIIMFLTLGPAAVGAVLMLVSSLISIGSIALSAKNLTINGKKTGLAFLITLSFFLLIVLGAAIGVAIAYVKGLDDETAIPIVITLAVGALGSIITTTVVKSKVKKVLPH